MRCTLSQIKSLYTLLYSQGHWSAGTGLGLFVPMKDDLNPKICRTECDRPYSVIKSHTSVPIFCFVYTPLAAVKTSFSRTKAYPSASNARSELYLMRHKLKNCLLWFEINNNSYVTTRGCKRLNFLFP